MSRRATCASIRSAPARSIRRVQAEREDRAGSHADYWKPGRPYLDGIEYTIIPNRSTAILAFVAGKFDLTFPYELTVPLLKDVKSQAPQAVCDLASANNSVNLLVNREAPPFDNPELRRALALALDRKSFIDILAEGQGDIGGAMLPPPAGVWGMPADVLATIPGYAADVTKNRAEAREIMTRLGYGPDKRLPIKVAARNIPNYRDPAIILIDQLKAIWIDGELDPVETAAKTTRSASTSPAAVSTIPTSNSSRITPAGRSATIPAIATPSSKNNSSSSRRSLTATSAAASSGRSIRNCRRMGRDRSSITPAW